jgi:transposase
MGEEQGDLELEGGAMEGGRRPTGVAPAGGATRGGLAPGQRWSLSRKREVVLRLLRGESVEAVSRELGVEIYRLEKWRDKGLSGIDAGLKEREGDPVQAGLDAAMKRIGELTMQNELLWQRVRCGGGCTSGKARTTSVSQAGASAHAGEPTAVPLPWPTRESPRPTTVRSSRRLRTSCGARTARRHSRMTKDGCRCSPPSSTGTPSA